MVGEQSSLKVSESYNLHSENAEKSNQEPFNSKWLCFVSTYSQKTDSAQWAELGVPHINRESSKHYLRQERCSQQLYSSRVRTKEKSKNLMPATATLKRDITSFK